MSEQPAPRRAVSGLRPRPAASEPAAEAPSARLVRANRAPAPQAAATPLAPAPQEAAPAPPPAGTDYRSPSLPKYLRLVRRESRLHSRQVAALTELTRRLNHERRRGRTTVGERITDNTLVRVAVDLLLAHPEQLSGVTEDDLRASVGLPPLEPTP